MAHRIAAAEFARLSSLYRYGVLDSDAESAIDLALQGLAVRLDVPVVQLVFADAQRFWAKASVGPVGPLFPRGRGPLNDIVTNGPEFLVADDLGQAHPPGPLVFQSFAGLRLASPEDESLGVLYVADTRPRDISLAKDALAEAAAAIQAILESGRRQREDEQTGALKRDCFLGQARRLIEVTRIGRQWISLVTLDLAPFRSALEAKNAGLGSLALRHMADLGRTQVRRRDSFGHLDTDLFALLLTDTGEAGAQVLAQRLSRHLERGWTDAGLAFSGVDLGITSIKPSGAGDTIETLIERAAANRFMPAPAQPASRVA